MKIFAGGIATETNTFCPIPTALVDFTVRHATDDVVVGTADFDEVWGKLARARGYQFVRGLSAAAQPSGTTLKAAYEQLRDEMLDDLRSALPVDVVLLMLHGAMVAQGYDDCEEDMIVRVREIVGPDAVIGVELDLHCHLRESMICKADIVITYKEYPHVDVNDRARELFELSVATRLGSIRPKMALFDCHMIGMYPTTSQPLRGFVDAMSEAEKRNTVLSLSFGHGFQFADVPHVGAKVLAITDGNQALAEELAQEFGMRAYGLREKIGFERISLPLEEALSKALAAKRGPVVVADQSDNAGGGAPADSTYALQWLLDHKAEHVAMAIFCDPEVVKIAKRAGKGSTLEVRLGGKLGRFSGAPVDLEVTVGMMRDDYVYVFPRNSGGDLPVPIGNTVALHAHGIDLIVSSERSQCFAPSIFVDFGIDPRAKRILVVKSSQHFYGAFAPIASEVIYMSAMGAVPPDPRAISYRRFDTTDVYPWKQTPLG